jgi:hypothetical protein
MTDEDLNPGAGHPVLAGLADALSDYFALLDRGVSDPEVDAAVLPLVGLSLHSLDGEAASRVDEHSANLQRAVRESTTAPSPIDVSSVAAMAHPSALGYSPALAGGGSAGSWAAWLSFDSGVGDRLHVRRLGADLSLGGNAGTTGASLPRVASAAATEVLVRPTLGAHPAVPSSWVMYAAPVAEGWQVRAHELTEAGIGPAEVVTQNASHSLNQEAILDAEGRIHVVHQELRDGHFRVVYRTRHGPGEWTPGALVSEAGESAWDPCLALDQGTLTVFWSCYRRGRFRLMMRRLISGTWTEVDEVATVPQRHAMHPQCVADPDGGVWLTYDALSIPEEASSGLTRYVRAEVLAEGRRRQEPHDPVPGFELSCQIEVLLVGEDWCSAPRSAQVLTERTAACYPRVAVDPLGRLWLAYRSMRQLPFGEYVAHAAVRVHQGSDWSAPRLLPSSDGTCAEVALVAGDGEHDAVRLIYHGDNHTARHLAMLRNPEPDPGTRGTEEEQRREHLRLPSTERVAAGGHVGAGRVTVATLNADLSLRPTSLRPQMRPLAPETEAARDSARRPDQGAPTGADASGRHLYWGDLHRHSNISRCGAGLDIGAEDHYRFAEDLLGLDFWALTDHAEHTSDVNWHYLKKLANAFNRPGTHTSLVGFEWTSFKHGHLNVIYAGADGPIYSSVDPVTDDPAKLWSKLEGHRALTIPHHPASWVYPTNWTFHHDEFLRLVEVFQACTGSYESHWCHRQYQDALAPGASVQDALHAGHRLGFIGSTDHGNGVAYVGVYAERLDRAAVLQALADRRCFAATRRGIVPHLEVGPASMGQELSLSAMTFGGSGIAELSVVELVRDGVVVATSPLPVPQSRRDATGRGTVVVPLDLQVISHMGGARALAGTVTVDGDATLRATEWLAPEVDSVSPTSLSWSASLPEWYGKRQRPPATVTLGVTLDGDAGAEVAIEAGPCQLQATLGDLHAELADREASRVAAADGWDLRVRQGAGGLTGLGADSWQGTAPTEVLRPNSWYYVRVIQVDGEIAWSSPVWVDA